MARKVLNVPIDQKSFQQGDVIIDGGVNLVNAIKTNVKSVLQEGEHTGHRHQFAEAEIPVFTFDKNFKEKAWNDVVNKVFSLKEAQPLTHEEHKPIQLPPDNYKVTIVREYDYIQDLTVRVAD